MKTIKQILLTIAVLFFSLTAKAYDFEVDGIYYSIISLEDLTALVTSGDNQYSGEVIIPSSITFQSKKLTVTCIGVSAFSNCSSLVSITIPNSVTEIWNYAFSGCSGLTNINIPNSVTKIEDYAFNSCYDLENLCIEDGVTTLRLGKGRGGLGLFCECPLRTLYLGRNTSGYDEFYQRTGLESLTIGNNVTKIGAEAFRGCSGLTNINIPNSVTEIGDYAFCGCSGLTNINIPNSVTKIGLYAFSDCSGLTNINIPNYVTIIEHGVFSGCSGLTNINIPNSVTEIWLYAFSDCSGLTSISIPKSITKIQDSFGGCTSLKNIYIEDSGTTLSFYGDFSDSPIEILYLGRNIIGYDHPFNCSKLKLLTIGNRVTNIGDYGFNNSDSLMEINIKSHYPPTVETTFSNARYINTIVNVPTVCLSVYQEAEIWKNFWNLFGNDDLISLFEIDGIKYSIMNNENVEIIDNSISELTELYINNTVEYYGNSYNVVSISDGAFKNCPYLSSVQMEDGIEYIGKSVFEGCAKLEVVNISPSLRTIGAAAFKNCSLLDGIILPDSITVIPSECFYECKSLSSMVIPSSVVNFQKGAFEGCSNLKELIFEDGEKPLIFPNGEYDGGTGYINVMDGANLYCVINYYDSYFSDLPVEKLYIGRNLANESRYTISDKLYGDGRNYYRVSSYDAPFSKFSKLKELTIGENVDILGPEQEYISEVKMYITSGSFKNCSSIQTIEVKNSTPPAGAEFANNVYSNAKLIVPMSSINLYEEAEPWKNFVNLMKFNITYIVDNDVYLIDTIATGDTIVLCDAPTREGHTFSGWSEAPETMPAEDIEITGSFSVNTYAITYIVDGEVYATDSLTYGSEIVLIDEPTKEGHTFSWSETPETMPAEDIEITGSFSVNTYAITYMVDGEVYATDSLAYGSEIVLIDEPTKEGYTFSGWSEAPETMPAEDIEITGSFSVNTYAITYMVDGEVYATDSLAYGSEIVLIDEPTKEGYSFSGWSEAPETMPAEDITITGSFIPTENVSEVEFDANIQTTNNGIILLNANNNWVRVYTINGILVKKIDNYTGEEITLNKGIYIVSVGDKAIKIML